MSAGSQDVAPSLPTCLALASVSLMCFVAGFGTGAEFVRFLSFGTIFKNFSGGLEGDLPPLSWREAVGDTQVYRALGIDAALLILFVLQHSVMAWPSVKGAVTQVFGVLNRSLYILCTAISLQVYYHCFGMGDPLSHKAPRVARLYAHLRHPIYLELLVIMWAVPALSPDRLLLSSFLTLYLSLVHRLDVQDYTYLSSQLEKKFLLFSREEENGRGELWKKE
ncbi:nurim isoform X2 [Bombina bombina]|uniref:nurim isoform X2 n=1 Tax=Bombina bombina TaxID=8345 RepID=UPI00235B12D5|nr:nurim isoform X2 [Bombina bombina]